LAHYRWHALFGRRLRVERVDKRRSGQFVHVELLPGVFTVVAAWMLDASACAGMDLGAPRVSLAALSDLEDLLKRRGLRRCSPGEITAGEGQTDARPASQSVLAEATADAVRFDAAARDEPARSPGGRDTPGDRPIRSGRSGRTGGER
jgi:hypothetical protein